MAESSTNPYFSDLFTSFQSYIEKDYSLVKGNLASTDGIDNDKLSKFTAGMGSNSAFINIAGNYKYTCIVPKDKDQPPNYIGVLKENKALDDSFMDELFSFTDSTENGRANINCTRAAEHLYDKAYKKSGQSEVPQTYCINFTDGMPYSIYEPALREVHKDISKQLNSIIDYAIATGQNKDTVDYDNTLINNFLNIFFTPDGKPRYYALRTGILPSAIAYSRFLQAKQYNATTRFSEHYHDFETELNYLKKGLHFIPIGRSEQFLESDGENDRLFWYPFNSKLPYSYKYITSDGTKDKERYEVVNGFNHYHLTGDDAQANELKVLINSTTIETPTIDATLSGPNKMILSYKSCLSDVPAPKTLLVLDSYNTMINKTIGNASERFYKGNLTKTITKIENWANIDADNNIEMHPLLNYSGYTNDYLKVEAEKHNSYITEENMFGPTNSNIEELFYYNSTFKIQSENRALNRMNFYSSREDEKSVDPYALEFGVISRDLYTAMNDSNELKINRGEAVNSNAYGILGKLPNGGETIWQTVRCGITETIDKMDEFTSKSNYMFSVRGLGINNEVPAIDMNITTLHYGDPHGGKDDKDHGCNFYADEKRSTCCYDCHRVFYLDTGEDYHEKNYKKNMPEKEFNENKTVRVAFSNTDAVLGVYVPGAVYNMSNMTINANTMQGYYYTVHILADDGNISARLEINPSDGTINEPNNEGVECYGTGIQYFFGGNCDKTIFDSYYNRGLTLYQLFDPTKDIYSGKNKEYGRVVNGLRFANRTFEWDYNIVLKAWNLALWIMRGYPNEDIRLDYSGTDVSMLYKTNDAALALAAFFDYIYKDNGVKLVLGPSLKQINNAVGPYGSNSGNDGTNKDPNPLINKYGRKGVEHTKEYDNKTLRGASWDVIKNNNGNRGYYNGLANHARVAATVFVNRDSKLYNGSNTTIGKNGVGRRYWSKGYTAGTDYNDRSITSQWGEHNADARRLAHHSEGYLHLDHYSWAWHMENSINNATEQFAPTVHQNNLWHGAFMIHARKKNEKEGYNAPFNWHLGPFHEVSPEAKQHTNEYGVRNRLVYWRQQMPDGSRRAQEWNGHDADGGCWTGAPDNTWKQAWDGINGGWTHGHQNPNIRIRLPFLWRYLKSLREKGIYTDGQLMPCGIELHYCNYRKSLMTSITNAEHDLPISTGIAVTQENEELTAAQLKKNNQITMNNIANWQSAITSPGSVTFAEVLYDTYAITKNTINTWYNLLTTPEFYKPLIHNILESVWSQSDKLTAMYRAKRYINSISDKLSADGKTIYNIPILPSISLFGATETKDGSIDESIVIGSDMKMMYSVRPEFDLDKAKCNNVAVGVTYPPVLHEGQTANQFTAISSSIYADMSNFDGDTIGWIVPIPTKANLALLNAYDGSWRKNKSSVIPLTTANIYNILNELNDAKLHWIGWVNSDNISCISANDLSNLLHICYDSKSPSSLDGSDVAVVPMVSLKITPYYNNSTDCNVDGSKCAQSEKTKVACKEVNPFSVKFEIDTRGTDDSLKLVMIRDKIEDDDVEYKIYNISNKVPIGNHSIMTYMTTVSYDKDRINIPSVLRPL